MSDVLDRILEATRARLVAAPPAPDLEARARAACHDAPRRSLRAALSAPGIRVIAECKRRSPSAGWLREDLDPVAVAGEYQAGGAAAVSVVTEPEFFAGDPQWLAGARAAVSLPVLRKDFLLEPRQLFESALLGADAVLLIARALPGRLLADMLGVAAGLGLETLVEIHDEGELERVLELEAPLVGVNARDLTTFSVDLERAAALASAVAAPRIAVVESGVGGAADVRRLADRGLTRLLVGGHLVRAADPRAAVAELVSCL